MHADLLLSNANVLTLDPEAPCAWFVAVAAGRIVGVGDRAGATAFRGPRTREMDCLGMTLAPGFNDAHCHLLALASSLRGVDCRPESVASIHELLESVRLRALKTPLDGQGGVPWIRAFGYDEFFLREKRHPNRWELDRAAPAHAVRLDHRTGHASVLSSKALELVGIDRYTADPVQGIIERDGATREPTGVLFEMGDFLGSHTRVRGDQDAFLEGIGGANRLLLSRGVTSLQDASPANDMARWETFRHLKDRGRLVPRVSLMAGAAHLDAFLAQGLAPGSGDGDLRLGAVKVMLGLATGALHPPERELKEIVLRAHRRGFPMAIHAVEQEAVAAAAAALMHAAAAVPASKPRHRIEHCSECPPWVLEKVRASWALVVTQPVFIYHSGEKYLSKVEEGLLPHLYPLASLAGAGVAVAAGSDAPVAHPDPMLGIYAAVTRGTNAGSRLFPSQGLGVLDAIRAHTSTAAYASGEEAQKGTIEVGKLADLVLLDGDPTKVEHEAIKDIKVMATLVGGRIAWEA